MSTAQELDPPPLVEGGCRVAEIVAGYPPSEREVIQDALANPAWSHVALQTLFTDSGHPIAASTLSIHRRYLCACRRRKNESH